MNVILLAAGLGTRLRPITDHRAKPTVPMLGVPMVAFPLYQLKVMCRVLDLSIDRVVVNLHHHPMTMVNTMADFFGLPASVLRDDFFRFASGGLYAISSEHFTKHKDFAKSIVFSFEHPEILDSAGGLKQAEDFLKSGDGESFLVVNADTVFFAPDEAYAEFVQDGIIDIGATDEVAATFLCSPFPYDPTVVGALWVDERNHVKRFGRVAAKDFTAHHNVGFYYLKKSVLDDIQAGPAKIFEVLTGKGHVFKTCMRPGIEWFETGDAITFKQLCMALEARCQDHADPVGRIIADAISFWHD